MRTTSTPDTEQLDEDELDQMDADELLAHGRSYVAAHGFDAYAELVGGMHSAVIYGD